MAFVNLTLFDNGTALSNLPILVCDFLLGAYPFACFIKENTSSSNLDFGFGKQLSFAENQMNVVVGLALVVVQSRQTFHAVPLVKFLREIFKYLLRFILRIDFGQGDNQFPCFNTFSLCAASLKFLLAHFCEIAPIHQLPHGVPADTRTFGSFLNG